MIILILTKLLNYKEDDFRKKIKIKQYKNHKCLKELLFHMKMKKILMIFKFK
jgi:hypothetical protein